MGCSPGSWRSDSCPAAEGTVHFEEDAAGSCCIVGLLEREKERLTIKIPITNE